MDHGDPAIREALAQHSDLPRDPLLWYRRAGDMGLATARCQHGLTLFRTGAWAKQADMGLIERHFRAGPAVLSESPEVVARALDDLKFCAPTPNAAAGPILPLARHRFMPTSCAAHGQPWPVRRIGPRSL
ncbi:MAG TPA: hypothetical protein VJ942_04055 [Roseovarius sp.]|nr:hypothetical protein [Roseovarius sp.]